MLFSVSTQSAPEGIRTPNLLIRRDQNDVTLADQSRRGHRASSAFVQVSAIMTVRVNSCRPLSDRYEQSLQTHLLSPLLSPSREKLAPIAPLGAWRGAAASLKASWLPVAIGQTHDLPPGLLQERPTIHAWTLSRRTHTHGYGARLVAACQPSRFSHMPVSVCSVNLSRREARP